MLPLTSHIVSYHVFIYTLDTPAHWPVVVAVTHASQFSSRARESRMRTVVLFTNASATGPHLIGPWRRAHAELGHVWNSIFFWNVSQIFLGAHCEDRGET